MRLQSTFELLQRPFDVPTTDGRILRWDGELHLCVNFTYELTALRAQNEDYPVDAVACQLWQPDSEGRVWSATSRFTTDYFVDELAMAQLENDRNCNTEARTTPEIRALFENSLVLRGLRFSSDDRSGRSLWIHPHLVQVIFKYSTLSFDVAAKNDSDFGTILYARLNQGTEYDASLPLNEIHYTWELPALIFKLGHDAPQRMLYSNGAFMDEYGSWVKSPIPKPLAFQLTDERSYREPAVSLVDGS